MVSDPTEPPDIDLSTDVNQVCSQYPSKEVTVRSPRLDDAALAIVETTEKTHVFTRDGDMKTLRPNGTCTCGHSLTYTPDEFTTITDSHKALWEGACDHQQAILNSIDCGGGCPQCDVYVIAEKQPEPGAEVRSRYRCAGCGAPRYREPTGPGP